MPYRRGIYVTQDSLDNWDMAKCHTRPNKNRWKHLPYREGFPIVTADEVLEKLLEMGVKRDKRTLRRYAEKDLIYKPETKSMGRGKGKITDYPPFSPKEFYASWSLINGYNLTYDQLKHVRDLAMSVIKTRLMGIEIFKKQYPDFDKNPERIKTYDFLRKSNYFFHIIAEKKFESQAELSIHFECFEDLSEYASLWFRLLADENATDITNALFNENDNKILSEILNDGTWPNMEDMQQLGKLFDKEICDIEE